MNIFVIKDGNRQGPYSPEQLKELVSRGEISLSDKAWHEGCAEWQQIRAMPELLNLILPPVPPQRPTRSENYIQPMSAVEPAREAAPVGIPLNESSTISSGPRSERQVLNQGDTTGAKSNSADSPSDPIEAARNRRNEAARSIRKHAVALVLCLIPVVGLFGLLACGHWLLERGAIHSMKMPDSERAELIESGKKADQAVELWVKKNGREPTPQETEQLLNGLNVPDWYKKEMLFGKEVVESLVEALNAGNSEAFLAIENRYLSDPNASALIKESRTNHIRHFRQELQKRHEELKRGQ